MNIADTQSSIDASPTYSGSRQRQFTSGLSRPKRMAGTANARAYGNAMAGANQTAANQRMATTNLKTSLAGQKARSDDSSVLAGLYAADYGDQVKRRNLTRQYAEQDDRNASTNLASSLGLMGGTVGLLGGLLTASMQNEKGRFGRTQRNISDNREYSGEQQLARMQEDVELQLGGPTHSRGLQASLDPSSGSNRPSRSYGQQVAAAANQLVAVQQNKARAMAALKPAPARK